MKNNTVKELYSNKQTYLNNEIKLSGWIRNHRKQKEFGFIDFNDGTFFNSIQIVYTNKLNNFEEIQGYRVGSSIEITGILIPSEGKNQEFEITATNVSLIGNSDEDFPIQPKRHTREFLREQAHLRSRTNLFSAVFRVRSVASMAIHSYFQENGYVYAHTPIITCSDCEGEDQMFKISTLDMNNLPKNDEGKFDDKQDLFGKQAYITGTGQLHGEAFALAFNKIYTFGPTFRTENSNTKIHANEFWMIEPEIAFADLNNLMDIEEDFLKYIVKYVLENCKEEIKFLDSFVEKGLIEKLEKIVNTKFVRITHEEVITILKEANKEWEFEPTYGEDIAKEHEKYITEYFNCPVFITTWPKDIKSFYMKLNEDGKTVAAVDLEVPGIGELMGGSQREDDYEKLLKRCEEKNVDTKPIQWYLDLRRFGSCPHAGFGLGFERLLMYLTGIENIRDVIPFPRTPGNCQF